MTEAIRREAQSPEAEDIFRTLAEQSPNMIFVNSRGKVAYTNRQSEIVLGYAREELCSEDFDFMTLIAPEYRELVRNNYRAHLSGRDIPSYEYVLVTKEGKRINTIIASKLISYEGERAVLGVVTDITERKAAEEAVRHSASLLSSTLESLDGFLAVVDRDLRVVLSNWKYHDFVTEKERQGRPHCYRIFKHQDAPCDYCPPRETFADGKPRTYEDRNPVDGRFMEIRVTPIFDAAGAVALVMEYLQDVTKRKQAEELLRFSEEKFSGSFHYSNDAIVLCDPEGIIIDVNQQALNQFACPRDEILALSLDGLHPPQALAASRAALREAVTKSFVRFEIEYKKKNGKAFPAEVAASLFVVGERKFVQQTIRDITERKKAEAALRESEERFRTLFEAAPDAIFLADAENGMIIDANPAAETLLQRSKAEIVGLHQSQLHPPEMADRAIETFLVPFGQAQPEGTDMMVVRKDGVPVPVHIEARVFFLGGRRVIQSVFRDMTEKKRAEEIRLQLERHLYDTQKLESLGVLAGGIAHDFNNLLQGVFGYISLARMSLDQKEKAMASLEQAEKALEMSVNLTSQLLTFARGGQPAKKTVELRPVVENAAKLALSGSRSDCQFDFAPGLRLVDADAGQMSQVIQNIVLNASQAMSGSGLVLVSAQNVDILPGEETSQPKGGPYVRIDIRDTGSGIPRHHLSKIFEPFYTTKKTGTGLGLATAYSILRNHEGWIEVFSEVERGSTFSMFLPAASEVEKEVAGSTTPGPSKKGRILLMDDNPFVRNSAGEMLRLLGHEVECAVDGSKAIDEFVRARESGRPFDVVILDLTVKGGMGGEVAIVKLREIEPDLKAIVFSGYANNSVMAAHRHYGFSAALNKPFKIDDLRDCLNRLLAV